MHQDKLWAACLNGECHVLDPPTTTTSSTAAKAKATNAEGAAATPKKILKKDGSSNKNDDSDDDDIDFGGGDSEAKASKGVRFVDDEADEENEDGTATAEKKSINDSPDLDASSGGKEAEVMGDDDDYMLENSGGDGAAPSQFYGSSSRLARKVVEPQESFSPSETNPPEEEFRRFLCWNHIGAATIMESEDDDVNTVDIHFTDSAFKRSITFTDDVGLVIGSLGEEGGIFASGLQDDVEDDYGNNDMDDLNGLSERTKEAVRRDRKKSGKDNDNSEPKGSQILFWQFKNTSIEKKRDKTWSLNLPDGEEALGVSCGEAWAAVMTSRRFLRFFSPGGTQGEVVWLKGDPVAMVGRGRFLAVFYHESSPLDDGTQKLGYTMWDAAAFRVVAQGSVSCLSKASELTWVGFSNEYALFAMDSDGMLSMLVAAGDYLAPGAPSWEWAPMLDTVGLRKSKDDIYWPITVLNGKLISIPLKGGKKHPDASRRPVTSALSLRMPLSRSGFKSHLDLEEASVRANLALSQKKLVNEMDGDAYEDDDEYQALCTDVVRIHACCSGGTRCWPLCASFSQSIFSFLHIFCILQDKVTLKLLYNKICAGQLDAALGLVYRLHKEETFDVAIKMADRHRQNGLAERIEDEKYRRFPPIEEEQGDYEDEDDYGANTTNSTHLERYESSSQISPEAGQTLKLKKRLLMKEEGGGKKLRVD
ncbi:MAG: hypothetical protein SGARI_001024 [Bacillariaceae sp.]